MNLIAKWRASLAASLLSYIVLPMPSATAGPGEYYEAPGTSYYSPSDRRPLDGSYRGGNAPAADWNGLYFGAHGGWAGGESGTSGSFESTIDSKGYLGGLHAGYNFQSGALVTGLEVDGDWTGAKGDVAVKGGDHLDQSADWLTSLRMRLGYTTGNWMFYGTAGVALGGLDTALTGPGADNLVSQTLTGYAAGIGAEVALTQSISARLEALHYGLSKETIQTWRGAVDTDLDLTTVRAGLSLKLN